MDGGPFQDNGGIDRRGVLAIAGGVGALALGRRVEATMFQEKMMSFELPPLRYPYDALEPYIDAETMRIHHGVHHRNYVEATNKAIAPYPELADKTIEDLLRGLDDLPEAIRDTIRNQGGGHANHQFFWKVISPGAGGAPSGALAEQIVADFGSFETFKARFTEAGIKHFGAGWAFLVVNPDTKGLEIMTLPNQDSVLLHKRPGLLICDLWEHAYYLKHRNRRAEWIADFWNIVNWDVVGTRLQGIREGRKQL
jgi:superoxide dismutase, Fe-Mn family